MEQKPSPSCNGEVQKKRKKRKKLQTLDTERQKFQGCLKHSNSFLRYIFLFSFVVCFLAVHCLFLIFSFWSLFYERIVLIYIADFEFCSIWSLIDWLILSVFEKRKTALELLRRGSNGKLIKTSGFVWNSWIIFKKWVKVAEQ